MRTAKIITDIKVAVYSSVAVLTSGECTYCVYLENSHPFLAILENGKFTSLKDIKIPVNRGKKVLWNTLKLEQENA